MVQSWVATVVIHRNIGYCLSGCKNKYDISVVIFDIVIIAIYIVLTMNDVRTLISLSADLLDAVEDWRFRNRIASRAEAIRRLLLFGVIRDLPAPENQKEFARECFRNYQRD